MVEETEVFRELLQIVQFTKSLKGSPSKYSEFLELIDEFELNHVGQGEMAISLHLFAFILTNNNLQAKNYLKKCDSKAKTSPLIQNIWEIICAISNRNFKVVKPLLLQIKNEELVNLVEVFKEWYDNKMIGFIENGFDCIGKATVTEMGLFENIQDIIKEYGYREDGKFIYPKKRVVKAQFQSSQDKMQQISKHIHFLEA